MGLTDTEKRNTPIKRGQIAEIVSSTQGVNYNGRDVIHYLLAEGLAKEKDVNNITIDNFAGEDTLTRTEAVQFIYNVLENGKQDSGGKPIMKERPVQSSDLKELKPLPDEGKDIEEVNESTPPTTEIGSVSAKELFDKTEAYAKELGYVKTDFLNTTGRFSEGEGITAGVDFVQSTGDFNNLISFGVRDWNNSKDVLLFKRTLENYGIESSEVVDAIDMLEVESGIKMEAQGKVFSFSKCRIDGCLNVFFTIWDE
ncbi:hypothetical protein [Bacillus solimangrovi]|uniref:SLH domain-containing protein n=1 Tax=Bacillus solimangrovi TaxID=1305675 RepID=A0A1E5LJA6_9BACI|nr:hypothetical protein [Bacillus solimangrovi]OEH94108.1 hypothetical protein BFG57_09685 [Bacillus solimangrovi]